MAYQNFLISSKKTELTGVPSVWVTRFKGRKVVVTPQIRNGDHTWPTVRAKQVHWFMETCNFLKWSFVDLIYCMALFFYALVVEFTKLNSLLLIGFTKMEFCVINVQCKQLALWLISRIIALYLKYAGWLN